MKENYDSFHNQFINPNFFSIDHANYKVLFIKLMILIIYIIIWFILFILPIFPTPFI